MSTFAGHLELSTVPDMPEVQPGDDLASLLIDALQRSASDVRDHDVLVVAQKVVSKAENRYVDLADVSPSSQARELAAQCDKDPRLVELILNESDRVVRCVPGLLIVRHRLGLVMANAGIDQSNLAQQEKSERALLLPVDPDASAARLKHALDQAFDANVGMIISDSVGRAWRVGTVGLALGLAGVDAVVDLRGHTDLHGRELQATEIGYADQIASAAVLLMGEGANATPVVKLRGLMLSKGDNSADALVRTPEKDLFL